MKSRQQFEPKSRSSLDRIRRRSSKGIARQSFRFTATKPSIPVAFSEAWTGSLATFYTTTPAGTRKRYGLAGNTFVAVVEFDDRIRAWAIRAGGQSSDPASPHFDDQALRYASGDLREVYFYRSDLEGHVEQEYTPGRQGARPIPAAGAERQPPQR